LHMENHGCFGDTEGRKHPIPQFFKTAHGGPKFNRSNMMST
jgi:hypothetical protein